MGAPSRDADPVFATQSTFRTILDAISRPGTIHRIANLAAAPAPLSPTAAAVAVALCDQDTPVWLDETLAAADAVATWLRFHCGCPIVSDPAAAAFAFVESAIDLPAFSRFNQGTPDYPDRSTTLVVQVKTLRADGGLALAGPGIQGQAHLYAAPAPDDLRQRLVANRTLFPRGIDLLFVTDSAIAALPRSVRIVES